MLPNMSTIEPDGLNQRHKARMQRKKAVVDGSMRAAQRDAGVIVVATGNGKGKSSSGFGIAARLRRSSMWPIPSPI